MLNFDEIGKLITENWDLLAAIVAILGASGIGGTFYLGWQNRRIAKRIRQLPAGDFPFDVIKPRSPDLLKRIMGGDEHNALADYKIPYQERQPDRNVRQELEAAFTEKNWVLILGKSGLGKTREAAHLADLMNQEGWTVLKLTEQTGEWLDEPKEFPSEISPDDKLLFFLDDLNRWMYVGNPHEVHPKAGEELTRPLREPVQERLPRLLRYFENQCRSPYVRVIATARNEHEPDKEGELSPWEKLQWEKYSLFWQQFYCYSLGEPSEAAIVSLLTNCVAAAGLRGNPAEYGQIARRNDGTFRNITLNLNSAQSRDLAVNNQEFSPRLDQTWRQRYNKAVQCYPLAKYAYDAVELLRTLNLWLTEPMLLATTKRLLPGRGVGRWWQEWQLRSVLRYLIVSEQILEPKDGQIEAKKTGAVSVRLYVPAILQELSQIAKRDPTYPVASECYDCGNALRAMGQDEEAITSFEKAIEFKPDYHEAWYNCGSALFQLGRYEEAIASFEKAIKLKPDYHEACFGLGTALAGLRRDEEAIASFEKAIKLKPDYHLAHCAQGIVLSGYLGRYEEAIASFEKAIELKPDYHEAWDNQGLALFQLGRYEEAIASSDKAIELKPDYHEAWYIRGVALSAVGYYEEVITSFEKAIELKPDDHEAWYNRGLALFQLGRYEEAITSYDKAIELKPDYQNAWNDRGIALMRLQQFEQAHESFDRAILLKPDDAGAHYNKACCYSLQGQVDQAIETLQHAITLDPENRELAKTDSDFDPIREDDRFQRLIGE